MTGRCRECGEPERVAGLCVEHLIADFRRWLDADAGLARDAHALHLQAVAERTAVGAMAGPNEPEAMTLAKVMNATSKAPTESMASPRASGRLTAQALSGMFVPMNRESRIEEWRAGLMGAAAISFIVAVYVKTTWLEVAVVAVGTVCFLGASAGYGAHWRHRRRTHPD